MVEHYLAKVNTRVRFPSLAPEEHNAQPKTVGLFLRPRTTIDAAFKEKELQGLFFGIIGVLQGFL